MVSNAQIIGVGVGSVLALIFIAMISSGVATGAKYSGLTDEQVQKVKIAKESCDNQADYDRAIAGDTIGDKIAKKCENMEGQLIAQYRNGTLH